VDLGNVAVAKNNFSNWSAMALKTQPQWVMSSSKPWFRTRTRDPSPRRNPS
jgi:hypothetical protein